MAGISTLLQGARFAKSIVPQSINDTDTNGTAIDCQGFKSGCFIMHLGAVGAADFGADGLNLTHCDTVAGSYETITGSAFTEPTQTDDDKFFVCHVDLRKCRRFIKWHANPGAAATLITAFGILYDGEEAATSTTERGVAETLVV